MGMLPMDIAILPPSDDRIFKKILTSPESKPVLMDLIPAVIKRPVVDVTTLNNELPIGDTEEKAERLDLNCVIDDGSQVDIEMQASHIEEGSKHKNLKAKCMYYLCDLQSSQKSKGIAYDKLVRTYQITFCSYSIFLNRKNFINSFSMRHDLDNGLFNDAIQVIFVELSKLKEVLKKPVSEMSDLEKWAIFLNYAEKTKYRKIVNNVIESKEELTMASELLMGISQDQRERAIFRSRRMFQTDLESNMITAERIGIKKGRAEGKIETARNLIKMHLPIEQISEGTGLSTEEINKILKELK